MTWAFFQVFRRMRCTIWVFSHPITRDASSSYTVLQLEDETTSFLESRLFGATDPWQAGYQTLPISDVLALAWPESQGFGPAWSGFGLEICEAKPTSHGFGLAWLGFGLGLGSSTQRIQYK
jgi:hypothetical protein